MITHSAYYAGALMCLAPLLLAMLFSLGSER